MFIKILLLVLRNTNPQSNTKIGVHLVDLLLPLKPDTTRIQKTIGLSSEGRYLLLKRKVTSFQGKTFQTTEESDFYSCIKGVYLNKE